MLKQCFRAKIVPIEKAKDGNFIFKKKLDQFWKRCTV